MNPSVLRIAGPQLGTYLKMVGDRLTGLASTAGTGVASKLAGSGTLQAIGAGSAEEAAKALSATQAGRLLSSLPVSVGAYQKVAPYIPQVAGAATETAINASIPAITTGIGQLYGSVDQPFSQQQYTPGQLPMTNYQAAESMLAAQRYRQQLGLLEQARLSDAYKMQNQLELLQARQGMKQSGRQMGNIIDLNENPFATPAQTYE